jgi:hypothetical protein
VSEFEIEAKALFEAFVNRADERWGDMNLSAQMEWVKLAIPIVLNRRLIESNRELVAVIREVAAMGVR